MSEAFPGEGLRAAGLRLPARSFPPASTPFPSPTLRSAPAGPAFPHTHACSQKPRRLESHHPGLEGCRGLPEGWRDQDLWNPSDPMAKIRSTTANNFISQSFNFQNCKMGLVVSTPWGHQGKALRLSSSCFSKLRFPSSTLPTWLCSPSFFLA